MSAVLPKPLPGYKRSYWRCTKRGCTRVYYKDFIPYSLSTPILTTACGHFIGNRDLSLASITRTEFYERLRRDARDTKGRA